MTYKLLVVHDIHLDTPDGRICWAYARRSAAIQRYAPPDFIVETCQFPEIPWKRVREFDICLNLEYCAPSSGEFRKHGFRGPLVCSYNSDSNRRREYWPRVYKEADWLIVNNRDAWTFFGKPPRTCVISNGVDTETFAPQVPISERPHKCIFAGSTGPRKMKGWAEVFRPLEKILPTLGFETDFRPVDDIKPEFVMPTGKTVEWYNSASYVLIASMSEGTPNIATEGVSCGCVLVSVPVGNCLEWGIQHKNMVFVERNADSFASGLLYAREHRERLSAAGMDTVRNGWSYGAPGNRADYYFALFRRLLKDGPAKIRPFSFMECSPDEI